MLEDNITAQKGEGCVGGKSVRMENISLGILWTTFRNKEDRQKEMYSNR